MSSIIVPPKPKLLLPFQAGVEQRNVREKAHFNFMRMGLGKTPTTVASAHSTGEQMILILCPKNAMRTWQDHFLEWYPGLDVAREKSTPVVIKRWAKKYNDPVKRRMMWKTIDKNCVNVHIMTYQAFIADFAYLPQYDIIIPDECKRIRSRKAKAFEFLKKATKHSPYFWPLTGTPGRIPADLWTLFHLKNPKYYSSYWTFVKAFHHSMINEFGRQEILGVRNEDQWFKTLGASASVITKAMVRDQIPSSQAKVKQPLDVEMDDEQERIYKELDEQMFAETGDRITMAPTSMTKYLRFRQLLCCPRILGSPSIGAAMTDLVDNLKHNDWDPHCVIFTPFTEAIPHYRDYLASCGFNNTVAIQGGLTPDELQERIERFRETRGIAITSILYATAFSLEPASYGYFIGYDYDPENNDQAEDRLVRMTTDYLVNIYYYRHEGTYEEAQLENLVFKRQQHKHTFNTDRLLHAQNLTEVGPKSSS